MFSHHDDDHHDDHDHDDHEFGSLLRIGVAALILLAAIAAACIVMVPAGQAGVITRFGNPVRVVTEPGLAWKLPAPFESTILIDLRLRTTSTGLQDVGTRDGLRVLVQSYVAWQVPDDPQRVRQFLRSVRNQPDEAARQLRSFVSAALHVTSSNFDLTDLVNVDSTKVQLDTFERQLREQVAPRMLAVYGIDIRQVGVERMTLPDETLAATVSRMRAERETVAAERTADGLRQAAAIRADADRDAREVVAQAREQAAHTEADAQQAAAKIYAKAYQNDPGLYSTLRSLDALSQILGRNSSLVLRTDAAPFRVLVDGPGGAGRGRCGTGRQVACGKISAVSEIHSISEAHPTPDPAGPPPPPPPGPIAQSVAIGFRTVYIAGALLLLLWLASNVREIASDSQAVVLRFGRIVRSQEAGLLIAWAATIEQVQLLPGPERQLTQEVAPLAPASERSQTLVGPFAAGQSIPQNAAAYLTGDGNVVLLNASLFYRISDPVSYALSQAHVEAALNRLFRATTVRVTAARNLNDFLVVQAGSDAQGANQTVLALRGEVRNSLIQSMNARLHALADGGASLGVEIERIDMTAWLPPQAKSAFDAGTGGEPGGRSRGGRRPNRCRAAAPGVESAARSTTCRCRGHGAGAGQWR